jgi:HlyD family secretion protein
MRCGADIFLGRVEKAIAVPIQAVHVDKGKQFVWVRGGSKYDRREIRIGRRSESMIEVLEGLGPGETVLLRDPLPGEIA